MTVDPIRTMTFPRQSKVSSPKNPSLRFNTWRCAIWGDLRRSPLFFTCN